MVAVVAVLVPALEQEEMEVIAAVLDPVVDDPQFHDLRMVAVGVKADAFAAAPVVLAALGGVITGADEHGHVVAACGQRVHGDREGDVFVHPLPPTGPPLGDLREQVGVDHQAGPAYVFGGFSGSAGSGTAMAAMQFVRSPRRSSTQLS